MPITMPSFSSIVMSARRFLASVYASSHDPAYIQEESYVTGTKRAHEL